MRFLIFSLMVLTLSSCSPKSDKLASSDDNQSASIEDSSPEGLSMKRTDKDSGKEVKSGLKTDSLKTEEQPAEFSGPLTLQRIKSRAYILPVSLLVGSQVDPLSPVLAEREADYLVRDFLNSYRKGRIAGELLSMDAHPLFLEELDRSLETGSGIVDFYMGTFRLLGDHSQVSVALLSEAGSIDGVIYMKESGGLWSLQDWDMPFADWPGDPIPRKGDDLQIRAFY